jgi:hypothetical protein
LPLLPCWTCHIYKSILNGGNEEAKNLINLAAITEKSEEPFSLSGTEGEEP